ncbi:AraC family transcriptional regulator [Enterococcus sp. BWB1-3]|uniref:AraC family transcriptional regulator n=1 Tax=unclassified Enterococcus TaxID=2608891 RepID=UPI001923461E|nr:MULTISPECIES: AraC family transcriptional regulator [unclassified Enterococcus]MBL1227770.1 AraC family transcriptional regulator [Enterococcus sp. BWB1-3]MCB5952042.1 AraC family transcriptional regulator [Enterococcus sp. BWT-B8]MCB5954549.1 AraC family transcriptional regulator [Enterococcus sp. CWB-B31]
MIKYKFVEANVDANFKYLIQKEIGGRIEPHWHNEIELNYVKSGKIDYFQISDRIYSLEKGDFIVVNSEVPHSARIKYRKENVVLTIFLVKSYMFSLLGRDSKFNLGKSNSKKIATFFEDFIEVANNEQNLINKKMGLYGYLNLILYEMYSKSKDTESAGDESLIQKKMMDKDIKVIKEFIDSHYLEDISLDDLFSLSELSESKIRKEFKSVFGMTIYKYILFRRLNDAKFQLLETDLKIKDIAIQLGFYDAKSFIRNFKNYYKMTPQNFRKKNIGNKKNKNENFD